MPTQVYQKIALILDARDRCIAAGNVEWTSRHNARLDALMRVMPRGSGFDAPITLQPAKKGLLAFEVGYHAMNEYGCYSGWLELIVTVKPHLAHGFTLAHKVTGRPDLSRAECADLVDYVLECMHGALSEDSGGI
jgi:hypothetical protein